MIVVALTSTVLEGMKLIKKFRHALNLTLKLNPLNSRSYYVVYIEVL